MIRSQSFAASLSWRFSVDGARVEERGLPARFCRHPAGHIERHRQRETGANALFASPNATLRDAERSRRDACAPVAGRRPALPGAIRNALLGLLLFALPVHAFDRLYTEALQAIEEGIPQVGIQKLRSYLAGKPTEDGKVAATLRLAEALITTGQTAEARTLLLAAPPSPEQQFLIVQSHLAAAEWKEALQALDHPTALDAIAGPWQMKATFARAEALRGSGQLRQAAAVFARVENPELGPAAGLRRAEMALDLNELPTATTLLSSLEKTPATNLPMVHYLQARLALAQHHYSGAMALFKQLQALPRTLSSEVNAGVQIGLARAQAGVGKADDAEDTLEKFAGDQPENANLEEVFAELDHVYSIEQDPSPIEMRRWTRSDEHPTRQALAVFYLSRFEGREKGNDGALDVLQNWIEKYPLHPLLAKILLEYGSRFCQDGHWQEALGQFDRALALKPSAELTGSLQTSSGEAAFALGNFAAAAARFDLAAGLLPASAETLLYNSALCWLRAGDFAGFLNAYTTLSSRFPESDLRRMLLVEKGRAQARSGDRTAAAQTLGQFTRDFADHRRVSEAHLILAELAFTASPSDAPRVEAELSKAEQTNPPPDVAEQAAYLRLFQPDISAPGNESDLVKLANDFLKKYPTSPLIPGVRMKFGEIYFRLQDYANARTQFEEIVHRFPQSPLLEKAAFLSAQSAVRSMNPAAASGAVETLEKVVQLKGPLQLYARLEQAQILRDSGKLDEALTLYADLLGKQPGPDLAAAAMTGQGETQYLKGATDPKSYNQAIQSFDQVASLPSISASWRHLALYKKGKALEKLEQKDDALVAWYDVLNPTAGNDEPEFFWYYRAGFDAAQLLESRQQWVAAIAIYQKMADLEGPRTAEAHDRLERLRLEHFIWEK